MRAASRHTRQSLRACHGSCFSLLMCWRLPVSLLPRSESVVFLIRVAKKQTTPLHEGKEIMKNDGTQTLDTPKLNTVYCGDCVQIMSRIAAQSVECAITDPPNLVGYADSGDWVRPAFTQVYRLLKPGSFCVSFYDWRKVDIFVAAWRAIGFRIAGHVVFRKRYAASTQFLANHHEQAYLLAKGDVEPGLSPMSDVIEWESNSSKLHPMQKPVEILMPLVEAFSRPADAVLDPFCGSGSTLRAAGLCQRNFVGIELDREHHRAATRCAYARSA